MILPGRYDITVPQGATLREGPFQLRLNGAPLDLTDCDLYAQIYGDMTRTTKLADLAIEWLDRLHGMFYVAAPPAVTATVTSSGYWDLFVAASATERDYWVEGRALLDRNVTRGVVT